MAKYSKELIRKIVVLIEEDSYTITEICKILKITRKSFYQWKETKPEFREAIEAAQEACNEKLFALARRSLQRKLQGYTLTEVRTVYIPDENDPSGWKASKRIVKEKEYMPDEKTICSLLDRQFNKENNFQKNESVLQITVTDSDTIGQIKELKDRLLLSEASHSTKCNQPLSTENKEELPAEKETVSVVEEPQKEEADKPIVKERVRVDNLPPGYLYLG